MQVWEQVPIRSWRSRAAACDAPPQVQDRSKLLMLQHKLVLASLLSCTLLAVAKTNSALAVCCRLCLPADTYLETGAIVFLS